MDRDLTTNGWLVVPSKASSFTREWYASKGRMIGLFYVQGYSQRWDTLATVAVPPAVLRGASSAHGWLNLIDFDFGFENTQDQ